MALNIASIRSVTRNPPMTLIMPKAIATTRMIPSPTDGFSMCPSTIRPPSSTMPWIALVPDIRGVCSVLGTFEITAKPTKPASTRIARFASNPVSISPSLG
ncbi:hypothetical protein BJF90_23195 [Pseudonocardia sp. CNS-004]|nr:hypothetical protein BJF90_23195 [Pseudonocardia sp. CNS-004]